MRFLAARTSVILVIATSFLFLDTRAVGAFWKPASDNSACERRTAVVALPRQREIHGNNSPQHKASDYILAMGQNLSGASSSRQFSVRAFAEQVIAVAQAGTFTRLDWEGPGGPSPVFATSLVLISTAYAVDLFDATGAWSQAERKMVIDWGNKLDRNQREKYQYSSLDSLAAIGAAKAAWGSATGQKAIFRQGVKEFDKLSKRMKSAPMYESNPRDNNEIIALLLVVAEAAASEGIDLYGKGYNGYTLHDAVNHHAIQVMQIGPKPIASNEDIARVFFRTSGYTTHLAWMPIYNRRFRNTEAGANVRKLNIALRRTSTGRLHGTNVGGPTECLWGRIR